ncbi:DUF2254 family protein [Natronoglycomyces albus]|uniref:DUF2254 domain-containing protein n=1 Tax=Natronoglycomyces albus TaxID=2811108 RepID=A0A895XQ37_9ACTN|nr:DUF2254 family protein [Natronoglycomyces albus]QSB04390.1 DUF2254 domain-containing protein [Natronoglycomyces albus]
MPSLRSSQHSSTAAAPRKDRSLFGLMAYAGVAGTAVGVAILAADALIANFLTVEVSNVESARTLIGSILGGIITVAVFSLWMRTVVVGLVSDQFSPRTMAAFLSDRFQHRLLSVMAGAIVIEAVLLLGLSENPEDPAPPLATLAAIAVALLAVGGVLLAIRRAIKALTLPEVVRELTEKVIEVLDSQERSDTQVEWQPPHEHGQTVYAASTGWVRRVDTDALMEAMPPGCVVHLHTRTGDFVTHRRAIATVSLGRESDRCELEAIANAIHIGRTRDASIDLALALGQLVDVSSHALNGGKDSATAHEALVHVGAALEEITAARLRPVHRADDEGRRLFDDKAWLAHDHVRLFARRMRGAAAIEPLAARNMLQLFWHLRKTAQEVADAQVIAEVDHQVRVLLNLAEHHGMAEHELEQLRETVEESFTDQAAQAPPPTRE